MPVTTPENWAKARHKWETSPSVSLTAIAKELDVAVATVSIRARRDGWVRVEPATLSELDLDPRVIAEQVIYRLHRLAMTSEDPHVILRASAILLDRVMGRAVEIPPLLPGVTPELPQSPEWLAANRLSYGTAADPEDAPPSPAMAPSRPDPPPPAPTPAAAPPAPPAARLRSVPPPAPAAFPGLWDSPRTQASGSYREVPRS